LIHLPHIGASSHLTPCYDSRMKKYILAALLVMVFATPAFAAYKHHHHRHHARQAMKHHVAHHT